jgi:hypothetical protein
MLAASKHSAIKLRKTFAWACMTRGRPWCHIFELGVPLQISWRNQTLQSRPLEGKARKGARKLVDRFMRASPFLNC